MTRTFSILWLLQILQQMWRKGFKRGDAPEFLGQPCDGMARFRFAFPD